MKILVMSDLHHEFEDDRGKAFCESLNADDVDVLVLAGDICPTINGLAEILERYCTKFKHVVYVPGNHDYWHSHPGLLWEHIWDVQQKHSNLHWLDEDVVEIEGQRFLGTPLWFPKSIMASRMEDNWVDFYYVEGPPGWIYDKNRLAQEFLEKNLQEGDIVVTHHLPSPKSIAWRWRDAETNCYFLCDMSELIAERNPKLWVHGHTHDSCRYLQGKTQIVCNPRGYAGHALNLKFDPDLKLEV